MTVFGIAICPELIAGMESDSTESSAIATASPFRLDNSALEPDNSPFGIETIPGLARGAP